MTYKELKQKCEEYKNLNLEKQTEEVVERKKELVEDISKYYNLFETTGKDFSLILENIASSNGDDTIIISHKCDTKKSFDYDDYYTHYEGVAYINVEIPNKVKLELLKRNVTQDLNYKPSYINGYYTINVLDLYIEIMTASNLVFSDLIEQACKTVLQNNITSMKESKLTHIQQQRSLLIQKRYELMNEKLRLKNILKLSDEISDLSNQAKNLTNNPDDFELIID